MNTPKTYYLYDEDYTLIHSCVGLKAASEFMVLRKEVLTSNMNKKNFIGHRRLMIKDLYVYKTWASTGINTEYHGKSS